MNEMIAELYNKYLFRYMDLRDITPECVNIILHQIETHKYFLNQEYKQEIPLLTTFNSWIEYVFDPFIYNVEKSDVLIYTDINVLELFVIVMKIWDDMKKEIPKHEKHIHIYHAMDKYCFNLKNYPLIKKFFIWMRHKHNYI